ncbi:MAG: hypothetical protein ACOYD4_04890 [Solirubrobacterales bacterium]
MSILDDAIREHLELKRAHGADESELKKLEDEAFGPPGRPEDADPFTEAPTEFLGTPAIDAGEAADEARAGSGRRAPNITDLQEAPPPPAEPVEEEQPAAEHQTIPVPHPEPGGASEPEPKEEPAPAAEIDAGPSTEERQAIADQPTEFFDVEAEMGAGAEKQSPTDEQLLDSQLAEPRLAPADPLAGIADTGPDAEVARPPDAAAEDEDEDEFFSEQRLSDELDRALEAPVTDEHPVPESFAPLTPTDEHEAVPPPAPADELEPVSDEHEAVPPPPAEEQTAIHSVEPEQTEEDEDSENPYEPETGSHDDVLEDTPRFLEDAPEDDDLWFEQKPPKDFDFDD